MSKWKGAPSWAKYHTIDADGAKKWHEVKPKPYNLGLGWLEGEGRTSFAISEPNWETMIEERPND